MSTERNKAVVRRIYEELWDQRKLEVADEVIARGGVNYDTGLAPMRFGPEEMKDTVRMVTAAFPDNRHKVEELITEGDRVVAHVTLTGTHEGELMGIPPTGRIDPARFAGLRVPTLLLLGSESPPFLRVQTVAVAAALPDARIVTLGGEGHEAMLRAPELFVREVTRFFAEL